MLVKALLFLYTFFKSEGVMWRQYNPNPFGKRVDDCVVRALAVALNLTWGRAFDLVSDKAKQMGNMPHADAVWGAVLREHGFQRKAIPNTCPDCYTAEDFCRDHPQGVYILAFGGHVATVRDGILFDTWNSSDEVPQYYWRRR